MLTVKAKVRNGRLVVDEATHLPEGQEVELVAVAIMEHDEDGIDQSERAELDAALIKAQADIDAGHAIEGDEVLSWLRARYRS